MKRVVYVAYFFPPTGGAGVQRSLKFIRYLSRLGWQTTVITVRESRYWMSDPSLLDEIPEETTVIRTKARAAPALLAAIGRARFGGEVNARRSGRVQRILRKLAGLFLVPDPYVGWVQAAARAARLALSEGGVLVTTSSPDSSHLVGFRLAQRGVPWIADFRDPWIRRMSFEPPTPLHRRLQERLEARVVRTADRVMVTSDSTRSDFLRRYPDLLPERVVCVPNGYDEEDFPPEGPPQEDTFVIVHAGQLNPERPVGVLLDHLQAFFAVRPEARNDCRVDLIGPRYREDEIEVSRRGLQASVRFLDALPHREAILRLLSARVLLLMEQESERGSLILPGKIFEYLRAGRPILGLVPHGAAWDLIEKSGAGFCALPSEPQAGGALLAGLFDAYRSGSTPAGGGLAAAAAYERKALARRFSAILEDVLRERGGSSSPSSIPGRA